MNDFTSKIQTRFANDMKYLADRISRWDATKDDYTEALENLAEIDHEFDVSAGWCLQIRASGDKALLTKMIRAVRTAGWKTDDAPPAANADYWHADYSHEDREGRIALSFSSTVCRRVKVGTRMVEQDVYETQCGAIEDDSTESEGPY